MRRTLSLLFILLAAWTHAAAADERRSLQAILFVASNEAQPSDPRLKDYIPELKRILRFERFQFLGQAAATCPTPGNVRLTPSDGHRLEIDLENSEKRRITMTINWYHRDRLILDQSTLPAIGKPTILLGPRAANAGEVFGLIVLME